MPPGENQTFLGPDDLGADVEAAGDKAFRDRGRVQRPVPDIGHIAGEEGPGLAPVGAVVVQDHAGALGLLAGQRFVAPGGIVFDAIRRVGDHEVRPDAGQ